MSDPNPKQYFATLPIDKIGSELMKRVDGYYEFLRNSGYYTLFNYSHYQMYKAMVHKGKILKAGNTLEYDLLYVNYFRKIGMHIINMTCGQRPTFKCKAMNTDASVQQQTKTADAVVEYYYRDKDYEKAARRAAEYAWFLTEGYIYRPWNTKIGKVTGYQPIDENYEDDNGKFQEGDLYEFGEGEAPDHDNFQQVHEGDMEFIPLSVMDVIRDWTGWKYSDCQWKIVRTFKNRYQLAKDFPEFKDKIMALRAVDGNRVLRNLNNNMDSDFISYYEFYHEDTDLVPGGLYIPFLSADTVLSSAALPYKTIPLDRMTEGELENRPFGYSRASDMLPLQVAYDRIRSIIISNQSTLGAQTFTVQEGANVTYDQLAEGMNVVTYGAGFDPPAIMTKLQTSPELFQSLEKIYKEMLDIAGMNETAMGNPSSDVQTFKGQALMNQLAIQNVSSFQNAWVKLLEMSATGMIETLQVYVDAPRFAAILGKTKDFMLKEWNRDDISDVQLVIAELGSPAQRTPGYIQEIAEMMMKYNIPVDPNKLFQSMQYNNLDFMTNGTDITEILIAQENEKLSSGITCVVSPADMHPQHIQEHNQELNNPEVRNNPEAIQTLVAHIMEHMNAYRNMDPAMCAILGIPPFPALPPPPPEEKPDINTQPHVKRTVKINDEQILE